LIIGAFVLILLRRQRDAEQVLACIDADYLIDDPTLQHRCEVNQNPLDWTPRLFSECDEVAAAIYVLPNYGHIKVFMCCVSGSRLDGSDCVEDATIDLLQFIVRAKSSKATHRWHPQWALRCPSWQRKVPRYS
jgi:hypothetical protein